MKNKKLKTKNEKQIIKYKNEEQKMKNKNGK